MFGPITFVMNNTQTNFDVENDQTFYLLHASNYIDLTTATTSQQSMKRKERRRQGGCGSERVMGEAG